MNCLYRFLLLGICLSFCSSCDKTLMIEEPDNDKAEASEGISEFSMTMAVTDGTKMGRASVDESLVGTSATLPVRWDVGDKVRMMVGSNADDVKPCDFVFNGTQPSLGSAPFEYVGQKVQTDYYYGIYPPLEFSAEGNVLLKVPVDGTIVQTASDDSHHLALYRPMYASPVQRENGNNYLTGVVFRHLTSLVVFKISNLTEESIKIKNISLTTDDLRAVFYSSALFNPQNQTEAMVQGTPAHSVVLSFASEGMEISSGKIMQAYLPVLPSGSFADTQLVVHAETDKGNFTTAVPLAASQTIKKFGAGGYCIFNLKKTFSGLTVDFDVHGWDDGEIVDVPVL